MSSTALLNIPELRDLLCEWLSQTDLINCVRVSKSWYQGFTSQLWSKIRISSPLQDAAFSHAAARKAIRRHRRFIRSFSGLYPASLRTLGDELFADMTMTAAGSQPSDDGDGFTELRELRWDNIWSDSLVLRLVAFSPKLQSLHLFGWCEEDSKLVKLVGKLDHLKTMTILAGASSLLPLEDFRALLKYIPLSVETLSIDCSLKGNLSRNNNTARSSSPPPSPSRISPALPNSSRPRAIKSLSLRGSALNTDPSIWSSFLSKCHNLQSFSVSGGMMNWNVHQIVEILQRCCHQLEELHLREAGRCVTDVYLAQFLSACDHPNDTSSAGGDTNDTNFTPLIQSLSLHEQQQQQQQIERRPRWKVFEVTALPAMGPLSNEALLAHTPTLEKVIVMDGNIMDSDTQYQILAQSPHLDTFKVLPDRKGIFGIDPHQLFSPLPQGIVAAPWACESTLQTLWLAIRPTTLAPQQQRQVMRQLGRLHQLTEFRLFNECVTNFDLTGRPGFTDLTLANGLDEWGGMKALRVVALLGFEHSFGDVEKEWVLEQWPVLENMVVGKVVVKLGAVSKDRSQEE
ncbi:hypothetical protein BGZ47_008552 [Haplosporangium gracile]|nr:hypothetical protein BGZ47_008552 [Haplosporangium gracile]